MLVDNAFDAIYLLREYHYEYVNPRFCEITGYSFKELTSPEFDLRVLLTPKAQEIIDARYKARRSGLPVSNPYQTQIINKTGRIVHIEVSTVSIAEGAEVAVLGIMRDVSKRVLAQEELHQKDAMLESIFRTAPIGIALFTECHFTWVNQRIEEITGYSAAELLNRTIEFLHLAPEDYSNVCSALLSYPSQPGASAIDTQWRRKDRRIIDVHLTLTMTNPDEDSPNYTLTVFDVTERRRDRADLQKSEERLKALINAPSDVVALLDSQGRVLAANSKLAEGFGQSPESLKGQCVFELMPSEIAERRRIQVSRCFFSKAPVFWIDGRDGQVYRNHLYPILNRESEVDSVALYSYDITENRKMERAQLALFNIANAVLTTEDLNDLYRAIQQEVCAIVNTKNFYIAIYDKANHRLNLPFCVDERDQYSGLFPAGKSMTAWVIKHDAPLLAKPDTVRRLLEAGEIEIIGAPAKIWLGVPLKIGDEVIGVLVVQNYDDENTLGQQDLEILEFASRQIAVAIERKRNVDMLRKSEEKYRTLFSESRDSIYITSRTAEIVDVNRAMTTQFGYTREELIGMNLKKLFLSEADKEKFMTVIEKRESVRNYQLKLKRKDGEWMQCLVTAS